MRPPLVQVQLPFGNHRVVVAFPTTFPDFAPPWHRLLSYTTGYVWLLPGYRAVIAALVLSLCSTSVIRVGACLTVVQWTVCCPPLALAPWSFFFPHNLAHVPFTESIKPIIWSPFGVTQYVCTFLVLILVRSNCVVTVRVSVLVNNLLAIYSIFWWKSSTTSFNCRC